VTTATAAVDTRTASWPVWSTTATVVVERPEALAAACALVEADLAAVDAAASRFRPDSALAAVNAAAGRWVGIPALLAELVAVALEAAELTGGAVDPSLGAALRDAGYDRDISLAGRGPQTGPRVSVRYRGPRWREVELAGDRIRIPRGTELDLGATAKAWTADHAAAAVHAATGCPVLVNLGGDLAVAGCGERTPFPVVLAEDHRSRTGPVVYVGDGGLATSTTTARTWVLDGQLRHHLIDPATGLPAQGPWQTATAAAGTCVAANTAATAAIVLGRQALDWLREAGLPARLVGTDGSISTINGWPADPGTP